MITIGDYTVTSLETIDGFDILTGAFKFSLDELQNASIAQTEEKQDITGKQGRKLSSLKRNKAVTISGANGLVSGGLLEMQTGGSITNKATEVMWADYQTVTGNAATTTYKAVGTTGAEIIGVNVRNANGTLGKEFSQDASVSAGKFTYDPAKKALAFNDGEIADGTEIVIYYKRKIQADVLENHSDNYSGKCTLYINAMAEDKCANIYRMQIFVPKADFSGEFTLDLGDNQTVHNFEAEALAGSCGLGGMLWSYTVFGADSADVA